MALKRPVEETHLCPCGKAQGGYGITNHSFNSFIRASLNLRSLTLLPGFGSHCVLQGEEEEEEEEEEKGRTDAWRMDDESEKQKGHFGLRRRKRGVEEPRFPQMTP
ncbi:hypothetical protein EYF80_030143 [Liparis tanakae]|uniref:Uncharacterized protein n=1 Tax=Liparis tanakae TaxID=230148 RepID=A0A4Z2H1A1_9TELE|nr:hypothetical protein EYF80_030143 [Liparis tanakae]